MAWVTAISVSSLDPLGGNRITRDANAATTGPVHVGAPFTFIRAQSVVVARIIRDANGDESGPLHLLTSPYPFKSALTTTSLAPGAATTGTPIS